MDKINKTLFSHLYKFLIQLFNNNAETSTGSEVKRSIKNITGGEGGLLNLASQAKLSYSIQKGKVKKKMSIEKKWTANKISLLSV